MRRRRITLAATVALVMTACGSDRSGSDANTIATIQATTTTATTTPVAPVTTRSIPSTSTTTVPVENGVWETLAVAPHNLGKYNVWTGTEFIAGRGGCCDDMGGNEVAAYSPATNTWRSLAPWPLATGYANAVWDGREMVAVGGGAGESSEKLVPVATVEALDPKTNRWRAVAPLPAPLALESQAVATVGSTIVAVDATQTFRYDVAKNRWTAGAPMPMPRWGATAIATGQEIWLAGGRRNPASSDEAVLADEILAYDPVTDEWRTIAAPPIQADRSTFYVWTGRELLAWGNNGAIYDPATDTWRAIAESPLQPRDAARAVWAGHEILIWGGISLDADTTTPDLVKGASYDPLTDTWRVLPPAPTAYEIAGEPVWTGEKALSSWAWSFKEPPQNRSRTPRRAETILMPS